METLYRIIELIDGEKIKGLKLIPYRYAEAFKLLLCGFGISFTLKLLFKTKKG